MHLGKLRSTGAEVAVKVQKPDMRKSFSLDLYILQHIGVIVDAFTSIFTNQPPFHRALYESFASGSYTELDYVREAANQIRFQKELLERGCAVVIPDVYTEYTTEKMMTSQWIDGVKLADAPKEKIRELIPVGVELFLTQLLDIGAFHAGECASM
jgi:aarF domain-containing kinase